MCENSDRSNIKAVWIILSWLKTKLVLNTNFRLIVTWIWKECLASPIFKYKENLACVVCNRNLLRNWSLGTGKLRQCGPTNQIADDSDSKPSEFHRWFRSDSKLTTKLYRRSRFLSNFDLFLIEINQFWSIFN